MRKVESLNVQYVGYQDPETLDEAELEILGLQTAIAAAQQRIAVINQSLKLQDLIKNSTAEENNAQTVSAPNKKA